MTNPTAIAAPPNTAADRLAEQIARAGKRAGMREPVYRPHDGSLSHYKDILHEYYAGDMRELLGTICGVNHRDEPTLIDAVRNHPDEIVRARVGSLYFPADTMFTSKVDCLAHLIDLARAKQSAA